MGLFHCPVGAVGRGGDGCIDCGLCTATSKEQRQAATEKIRAYIRTHAERSPNRQIRKIAVCGKGGAGKSTVTALLSAALAQMGYGCMVIDTDHSNGGLWRKLGLAAPPVPVFDLAEEKKEPWMEADPLYFDMIPPQAVGRAGNRWLMTTGKIEDPLQGCACVLGAYAQNLLQNLCPRERQLVLADQEAGVESFGRGIETACDTVLIVVEPSSESIELAGTIQYMAQGIGIRRVRAILNKVEDEDQAEYMEDALAEAGVRYLGALQAQKPLRTANLKGAALDPAGTGIRQIAKYLLDEAEMRYSN